MLFIDLFRHQADPDEDSDYNAEKRHRGQPQVDDDQALDIDGNLADQNRCPGKQQGKRDQVVQHAIAYRLAKSVEGDVTDPRVHTPTPRRFSVRASVMF